MEIYLDEYPAAKTILDEPLGKSNMVFAAGYESKYISVLYRTMLNDIFILYLFLSVFSSTQILSIFSRKRKHLSLEHFIQQTNHTCQEQHTCLMDNLNEDQFVVWF